MKLVAIAVVAREVRKRKTHNENMGIDRRNVD